MVRQYAPSITRESSSTGLTASDKTWWTRVTEFPIQATIEFRGLVRPSTLMSAIKLNVMFHGRKHISSGYYVITKEDDSIGMSGYKTTLHLLRTAGDDGDETINQPYTTQSYYNSSVGNNLQYLK